MGSIRGHAAKIRARTSQLFYAKGQIVDQLIKPAGIQHRDSLVDVEAVYEHVRIVAVTCYLTIPRQNGAVVVDGGLGPQAAEYAQCAHATEMLSVRNQILFAIRKSSNPCILSAAGVEGLAVPPRDQHHNSGNSSRAPDICGNACSRLTRLTPTVEEVGVRKGHTFQSSFTLRHNEQR